MDEAKNGASKNGTSVMESEDDDYFAPCPFCGERDDLECSPEDGVKVDARLFIGRQAYSIHLDSIRIKCCRCGCLGPIEHENGIGWHWENRASYPNSGHWADSPRQAPGHMSRVLPRDERGRFVSAGKTTSHVA